MISELNFANHAVLGASYKRGLDAGRKNARISRRGKLDSSGLIEATAMKDLAEQLWIATKAEGWCKRDQLMWTMLVLAELRDRAKVIESAILEGEDGQAWLERLKEHAFEEGFVAALRSHTLRSIKKRFDGVPTTMEADIEESPRAQLEIILLLLPECRDCRQLVERTNTSVEQWKQWVTTVSGADAALPG